jgi:arabinofuranosyltransferase
MKQFSQYSRRKNMAIKNMAIENLEGGGQSRSLKRLRLFLLLFFAVVTFAVAQVCDDAFHSFIEARNIVEGNGFLYNVDYRVTAATSPLFTLIIAGVFFFVRNIFLSSFIACFIPALLAFYIVIFKICDSRKTVLLTSILLMGSNSFIWHANIGLENPLIYFFAACYFYVYLKNERFSYKNLFIIALLTGLIALTRIDNVILFAPISVYIFIFKREKTNDEKSKNFFVSAILGVLGLLPFFCWDVFSVFYYGFPFPNTYYAKQTAGIPLFEYFTQGLSYILFSFIYDIFLLFIFVYIVITIRNFVYLKKNPGQNPDLSQADANMKKEVPVLMGIILFIFYVCYIGGDFMGGRFLTLPFFVSIIFLMKSKLYFGLKSRLWHMISGKKFVGSAL